MAITLKNAASDLAAALNGQTVGGVALVSGQNLFWRANHPDGWSLSVQLRNTGGQAPEPYINGSSPQAVFRAGVQVLVYGVPGEDGFDAAETLARGVLGFLQQATVSGYVQILGLESQPNHVVDPETQRHIFTLNLEATYTA